ncbi:MULTISPECIES: hypothetical protein [Weissella]|jgi:hypothetical protein|uniref:Uncharacterized protein n=2 Tax=Weissella cibaria TaxID=137591 RepID=A0A0D1KEC5_9LACO|nr:MULTISPECIES: hypothetical protein [Weissella]ALI32881.1 hypothetical protein AO080_05160 [Weissella cibaria]APS27076.1 hypothetical protein AUC63_01036 [Weissella cibaria]APU62473.1 hypothetical protein AUC65_00641 [Weissella cibaria]APU64625.1 hypothetical protein AUC62_00635 [Weissella cibaria]ASS51996.1 hypothetical protein CHR48_01052 [Weissella cibaria]
MQMTGNDFIAALKDETYEIKSFTAADQATINLDDLFGYVEQATSQEKLFSAELLISGDEPISLRVETGLVNLPIRYTNAISKIVINDPETEVTLYMIAEHPLVTKSGLRIETAATVAAFADDPESVESKIATFFDKELQSINEAVAAAESDESEAE